MPRSRPPRPSRRTAVIALALVMATTTLATTMAACTGSGDSATPPATDDTAPGTTPAPLVAPPVPTCAPARPSTAIQGVMALTSGGQARQYLVAVPSSYDGTVGAPLILDFHDLGFTSVQHEAYTLMAAKGAALGSVVVTPQATPPGWQLDPGGSVDDFAFVHDVVAQVESLLCIDGGRVHAVGFGLGGLFASLLACQSSDPIAAVGLVAGALGPSCTDRSVSVMGFHGTDDQIVPYDGQAITTEDSAPAAALPGTQQALTNWAVRDGCDPEPASEEIGQRVRHLTWLECPGGTAVTLYVVDGAGHTWPGGTQLADSVAGALGPKSTEVVATDLILAFFSLHPGPPG